MEDKVKIIKFLSRVIMIAILAFCVLIELYLHGTFQFLEQLDTVSTMHELTAKITQQLEQETEEFELYVKDLSEDEIKGCNRRMDGFLGAVDTYVIQAEKKDGTKKIKFRLRYSENGKVLKALKQNTALQQATAKSQQIYDTARQIIDTQITSEMSDIEKEKAIHDYLTLHCKYGELSGENKDESYKAYGVLVLGQGVCNGYAEAMYLLLNAVGVDCKMVVGTADGNDHAWNMVCLDNKWYHVDATWDDPVPDKEGIVQYQYFNVTDSFLQQTHTWEKEQYHECNSKEHNYFVYYKKVCKDYAAFQKKMNRQIVKKRENFSLLIKEYKEEEYDLGFILDNHTSVIKASYSIANSDLGTILTVNVTYAE